MATGTPRAKFCPYFLAAEGRGKANKWPHSLLPNELMDPSIDRGFLSVLTDASITQTETNVSSVSGLTKKALWKPRVSFCMD